jgi:hypothetical protein
MGSPRHGGYGEQPARPKRLSLSKPLEAAEHACDPDLVVDWTTVLVSLISGAAGLGGGLYAAKRQADAVLDQVTAENDRFSAQQAEEQRRNRESVYLEFVVSARKFSGPYAALSHAHLTPEAEDDDEMMRALRPIERRVVR